MSERRVLLDAAAFLDSRHAVLIESVRSVDIREIAKRYLAACYDDVGKAPRLLDGEELSVLLRELLPRHYGVKDPLAAATEEVLSAYLDFLEETEMVPAIFEQRRAFGDGAAAFRQAVAAGTAHADGVAVTGKPETIVHRADKVGRNDPCPCGSGKKFKKCCARIG